MSKPSKIAWNPEAEQELARTPFFVRALVRRKVEERVAAAGRTRVTLADFREAEVRHRAVMAGKSEAEAMRMLPRPNEPGVDMVIVEVCQNELSGCPNPLIKTGEWREALERWVKENNLSERLRARVKEDTIKFHHKFRFSLAGCPNACSRPQIADIGLVGFARPEFDPGECEKCGACAEVCPDRVITCDAGPPWFNLDECQGCQLCARACPRGCIALSRPRVRILAGGKLGRHPRLAQVMAEVETTDQALKLIAPIVNDYIIHAAPNERFADFLARSWTKAEKDINHRDTEDTEKKRKK